MRQSKRGPSLFELLEEADGPTAGGQRSSGTRRAALEAATDQPIRPPARASTPLVPSGADPTAGEPAAYRGRLVEVDGDRVVVSLTSATSAAAIFAVVAVVVAVYVWGYHRGERTGLHAGYEAGRASYAAGATSEIEVARSGPPVTYLVGGLLEEAGKTESSPGGVPGVETPAESYPTVGEAANSIQWIRNYTYVVAQEFSADHADRARAAQEFLAAGGVETAAIKLDSGRIQLITRQGYDRNDPTQRRMAEQLLEKVRAIGARYFASGGGYKLEGYLKTLKGDSW